MARQGKREIAVLVSKRFWKCSVAPSICYCGLAPRIEVWSIIIPAIKRNITPYKMLLGIWLKRKNLWDNRPVDKCFWVNPVRSQRPAKTPLLFTNRLKPHCVLQDFPIAYRLWALWCREMLQLRVVEAWSFAQLHWCPCCSTKYE